MTMVIGGCQVRLHIPASHSLKEKRKVVRSLVDRLRGQFNVSVTEVGDQDRWQVVVLGLATASRDGSAAQALLSRAADFIAEQEGDFLVIGVDFEVIPVF
jgi:uncharacterized protein YlxP (DUF503 family)